MLLAKHTEKLNTITRKTNKSKKEIERLKLSRTGKHGFELTSLGDDGSGGDDDDGPVELALEVADDLLADLVEGVD